MERCAYLSRFLSFGVSLVATAICQYSQFTTIQYLTYCSAVFGESALPMISTIELFSALTKVTSAACFLRITMRTRAVLHFAAFTLSL